MNKLVYASLLSVGLSISAFAATTMPIPTSDKPSAVPIQYAGVSTCNIDSSTGTTSLECATGSGIILDIIASSVATTDSLILRDSNTANTTSAILAVIDKNSIDKANRVFPRFKNGLSVSAGVAPGGHLGATMWPNWTIVYTKDLY